MLAILPELNTASEKRELDANNKKRCYLSPRDIDQNVENIMFNVQNQYVLNILN